MRLLVEKKYVLIIIFMFLFVFILIKQSRIKAEIAYFYPQNCLGSFIAPEKAQGEPEVKDPNLINEANSAVYLGGFKEIYCGNFKGPQAEGEIKKITLHFNWVLTKERRDAPIIEPTSTESESNILEKIIPPKTIEIIPNATPTEPQSFLLKFVFAEETATLTESSTPTSITSESSSTPSDDTQPQLIENQSTTTPTSSTSTENQITTTTTSASETITTTTSTPETSITTISTPPKTLFEIHYTLDGENWNYLGSIKEDEVLNAVPGSEFTLLPGINWLDISKIQIKINSLPDTDYYLYLESMWFEVEYELPQATSTISEITSFIGGTINSLTENLNTTSTSSEATTTSEEENDNEEENDEESTTTETELQNITTTPQIEVSPIKQRKYAKQIKIQNPDNISCKVEPFSIEIKEEETKTANLILSGKGIKNVEIGSLPTGIDIRVVEQSTLPDKLNNADDGTYEIQTSKDIVQLKIYRQKGSDKGNLTLPIIFSSGNSMIICQINVIAF
ncbi:MAG: hypothetical protein KatS3mg095_0433 [Candidatus Parcubacteria bacterium]|nr:MAG: hypothetical protein KatS3mg095_0433 [Candidatus Parcubacteria bacterium]